MLLKNTIMAQVGLCAVLICSHAYAMDEEDFTTPVSKNTRGANAGGPNEVSMEHYAAVSQRLWGVFEKRYKENDTIDKGNAKAVFELLTTHLADEEKIEALHGLLPIAMKDEIDLRVRLFNVEQASDATAETPK